MDNEAMRHVTAGLAAAAGAVEAIAEAGTASATRARVTVKLHPLRRELAWLRAASRLPVANVANVADLAGMDSRLIREPGPPPWIPEAD